MSTTIGMRELKNKASKIVQTVRDEMVEYIITVKGKPVAVLRPFTSEDAAKLKQDEVDAYLAELRVLADQVADAWQSSKSGVELIEEQRR
ncbi:MAG TPA: type II toxin-antitoxin system prevent-host-death family antitoxin [Anaerolineae bacterium]|nr:type II toxin-antitoxin system Phd/YefM family antitoxin [Anaerolineae bacterium]MCB0177548.1 type II toxin-antitoxin system Phd/YefM family antitoxin [Anaerolineae bacterium]MCB0226536.1 type II toxin-antitoxin system Phd/YefM family antitoxin [Anaerolineae bacterium]MCB9107779.1 type II toxin-antitoxin system Phd/YefM family antitoxin [Anaerolineales bacterium]HRV96660.1 type II toxin-antitoxin system prevent-host-death family antitoxin [Anaerolineae bacterium]